MAIIHKVVTKLKSFELPLHTERTGAAETSVSAVPNMKGGIPI